MFPFTLKRFPYVVEMVVHVNVPGWISFHEQAKEETGHSCPIFYET